jgi:hypothetical protein
VNFKEGLFDADGKIADPVFRKLLEGFLERFTTWIEKFATTATQR